MIVNGNPVNAQYTNTRVVSKQSDNSIAGYISSAKWFGSREVDIPSATTINALTTESGFARITGSDVTALNGISGGLDGRPITIYNVSTALMTISNSSGSAASSDQILTPNSTALFVYPGRVAQMIYDAAQAKWIVTGGTATATNEQSSPIANNQTSASVSGLIFPSASVKTSFVNYYVKRIATATVMEVGLLAAWYDGSTWNVGKAWYQGDAGIDFTITAGGQVQYTSDNMSGVYDTANSKMKWYFNTLGA